MIPQPGTRDRRDLRLVLAGLIVPLGLMFCAALLVVRQNGKPVSLFMLPNTARAQQLVEVLGHEAAIWCVGNRTFVLLSRQPKAEVEQLASFVRAGLH